MATVSKETKIVLFQEELHDAVKEYLISKGMVLTADLEYSDVIIWTELGRHCATITFKTTNNE